MVGTQIKFKSALQSPLRWPKLGQKPLFGSLSCCLTGTKPI